MVNYIMEQRGYEIMDLVDEIKFEARELAFALKVKQAIESEWHNFYLKMSFSTSYG